MIPIFLEKVVANQLPSLKEFKAFGIKYFQANLSRGARLFSEKYGLPVRVINKENYLDFISLFSG